MILRSCRAHISRPNEPGDIFPAPAPSGAPTGDTLNAFYGSAPNGVWRLFVVDDNGSRSGSIAGNWNVTLQTSTTACLFSISPTVQAFPATGGSGSFNISMPVGCSWTAATPSAFLGISSPPAGDASGSLSFTVAQNFGSARTGTINVTNGVTTRTFQVQQPSGCPTSLSATALNFGAAGGTGNVGVTAASVCTWQAATDANWIQVTGAPQSGDGTATFTVLPNTGSSPRSGTVTVGAQTITVSQSAVRRARFDFDGDGKADASVFRPSDGNWWVLNSGTPGTYSSAQWGISSDVITPADFDGDGKTDFAVYRSGIWYILESRSNSVRIANWGLAGDIPEVNDYDGDGKSDIAVFRPEGGMVVRFKE